MNTSAGTDLVHVIDRPEIGNTGDDDGGEVTLIGKPEMSNLRVSAPATQPVRMQKTVKTEAGLDAVNAAAKNMQSDAPACNVCGHITLRSGTCYKCLNCGNSMGCS
jgi:ribonucleoside-diphosphate reductase alpha chain